MTLRTVREISASEPMEVGTSTGWRAMPSSSIDSVDPVLLIDYFHQVTPGGADFRHAGVGPHPHRGFSPIGIVLAGEAHHRDSRGNDHVVYAGGVQWIDAGMGLWHSERPSKAFAEQGGLHEHIQIWINSPATRKSGPPRYRPRQRGEIPVRGPVRVLAGTGFGVPGAYETFTPIEMALVDLEDGQAMELPAPAGHGTVLFVREGAGRLDLGQGRSAGSRDVVVFEGDGDVVAVTAKGPTRFFYVSGQPIGEPVTWQGPFVMNTTTEILEAMRDAQKGKMGVLIEDFSHPLGRPAPAEAGTP